MRTSADQVGFRKEEAGFPGGVFIGVRCVNRVTSLGFGVQLAHRGGGCGRVGGADRVPEGTHGLVAFENHGHAVPARHELDEAWIERAAFVHRVKLTGLRAGQLQHAARDQLEARLLEVREDETGLVAGKRVGLDDRKRAIRWPEEQWGAGSGKWGGLRNVYLSRALMRSTKSIGRLATPTPAASNASIFSAAVPAEPEMIAPAWPILRPGGAVWPAMNPTTGFFMFALMNAAASCSSVPPISPIIATALVCGSSSNAARQSMKFLPLIGSPPMPTQVVWPIPALVSW